MATLSIGRPYSRCVECDVSVSPGQRGHYISLGYGILDVETMEFKLGAEALSDDLVQ